MNSETLNAILHMCDAGYTPRQIATAFPDVGLFNVYAVLRNHRPERKRSPRTRTSLLPAQVVALRANGVPARRIAQLLQVSRAYVYRILQEAA